MIHPQLWLLRCGQLSTIRRSYCWATTGHRRTVENERVGVNRAGRNNRQTHRHEEKPASDMSTERPQRYHQPPAVTAAQLPDINSPAFQTMLQKPIKPRQGHCVTNGSIILIDPPVSPPLFSAGPTVQYRDLSPQENDQCQPLSFVH